MKIFLTLVLTLSLSVSGSAQGIRCWFSCHCPPDINAAQVVPSHLRSSVNPPLKWVARVSGFVTTYAGKILGVQGWRNYHLPAQVSGTVIHAAGSSDGLYTIDLEIDGLMVANQSVALFHPSFIRVEVFPWVRFGALLPRKGEKACVSGKLMWDGDGFLEIHPGTSSQVKPGKC
jgi:hypothetical protein